VENRGAELPPTNGLSVNIRLPLSMDGLVQVNIDVENFTGIAERNQEFVLDVLDRLAVFAPSWPDRIVTIPEVLTEEQANEIRAQLAARYSPK
jgi:hypothetical protein